MNEELRKTKMLLEIKADEYGMTFGEFQTELLNLYQLVKDYKELAKEFEEGSGTHNWAEGMAERYQRQILEMLEIDEW